MSTALKFSSLRVHQFVQERVESALRPHGFSFDLARGTWRRTPGGGIEHFVSLPTDIAASAGPVVVTANLGVFCRTLAARLALRGDARRASNLATFTRNVGQLSAKRAWRDWVIRDSDDVERIARRLAARVVSIGVPWLSRFDSLSAVREGLCTYGREDHRQHALPQLECLIAEEAPRTSSAQVASDTGGAFGEDPDRELAESAEPAILSLRVDRDELTWHCDE